MIPLLRKITWAKGLAVTNIIETHAYTDEVHDVKYRVNRQVTRPAGTLLYCRYRIVFRVPYGQWHVHSYRNWLVSRAH